MAKFQGKIGKGFLWLVGGGVQGIVWFWSVGGAFFLSAFTFLLEAPLLFRVSLFIGSFLLSLAAISQTLIWATTRPRFVSSEEMPSTAATDAHSQAPPADASLALYPPIRDDEVSQTHFEKRTVYLADFARKAARIRWRDATLHGLTFVECYIVGPAVVVNMNTGQMQGDAFPDCAWEEGAEAHWAPDLGILQKLTGIVGLEDCLFRGCRFSRVGFLYRPLELSSEEAAEGDEPAINP